MVGEQLAALIGLSIGAVAGISMSIIVTRRGKLVIPLAPILFTLLFADMAIEGLVEGDLMKFSVGVALALCIYPLIEKTRSIVLRIIYSVLLIAVSVLFIVTFGIGMILRLIGILALVGMVAGIVNIIMLIKH
ncbi:hypothetical protein Igag_0859 [Ignisphaera aggregans DSM 17230]|uniref:Uncharacterized protein n=1 Tax=Ignisphaera aggregans (strain DSM 17230 / JCM 13409 / AQ1.S1) TaxID=583356 RepID=E0STR0_IGNAA|nr:hypothetical protein Igag_0859 [Ignisphaera aggregans DSM 17230]